MWPPLVAEIVSTSAVLDELMVTDALPSAPVVAVPEAGENVTSPVVPKFTVASGTGKPLESVTVTVAVECEVPLSARIEDGASASVTDAGTPGVAEAEVGATMAAATRPTINAPNTRLCQRRD
jgi:hypothetical protein